MKTREISVPELALIAGTRGMLGVGIGLLLAGKFASGRRLRVGRTLLALGAASTIPLAWRVFHTPAAATTQRELPL